MPPWKSDTTVDDEEVPAKKQKLVEVESDDSDDDFAAQLLEGLLFVVMHFIDYRHGLSLMSFLATVNCPNLLN